MRILPDTKEYNLAFLYHIYYNRIESEEDNHYENFFHNLPHVNLIGQDSSHGVVLVSIINSANIINNNNNNNNSSGKHCSKNHRHCNNPTHNHKKNSNGNSNNTNYRMLIRTKTGDTHLSLPRVCEADKLVQELKAFSRIKYVQRYLFDICIYIFK